MNMYAFPARDTFVVEHQRRLEIFAAQASGALELAAQQIRDTELRADLEQALSSRSVIDQALGIIMGQQRCAADQAFDLLRRRSQSGNRRLRDVAAQLVTSTTGGPPQLGRPFQP